MPAEQAGPGRPNQLAGRQLGVMRISFFAISASAPLTVIGGGVAATYRTSQLLAVPLAFLLVGLVLWLFTVGYAAMSRSVSTSGAFYAYLAHGLGKTWGVVGAAVALLAYNSIQVSMYGLFGVAIGDFVRDRVGLDAAWWAWALCALVVVGVLGVRRIRISATVLACILAVEVLVVVVFDYQAFTNPAEPPSWATGFNPGDLLGAQGTWTHLGILLGLVIAGFTGFESGAIYSEEVSDPQRTVGRATFGAVVFTSILYALSAWALLIGVGADHIVERSAAGPSVVFDLMERRSNSIISTFATLAFLTSVLGALISFHNGIARYLFALGHEHALPRPFGKVNRSSAPWVGSLVQSALALAVVLTFAAAGRDPIRDLFTSLSNVSAAGILLLMIGTSVAAIRYLHARPRSHESLWVRLIAPLLAAVLLTTILALVIVNFGSLLQNDSALLSSSLLGLLLATAGLGALWGRWIRIHRPLAYAKIGGSTFSADPPDA